VVQTEPKDVDVEALRGGLVADPEDDMVQLEDLERRPPGGTRHRRDSCVDGCFHGMT
jgi:hypothetical protein